jgi:predicted dehydrogenase
VVGFPITWKTPPPYWGVTHIKQIKNFYASLEAGTVPDVTAEEAFKSHEMIMAVYKSAKTHETVKLH